MSLLGKILAVCVMVTAYFTVHFCDPIPPQTAPDAPGQAQVVEEVESPQPDPATFTDAEYAPNEGFVEYPGVYLDNWTGKNAEHLLESGRHVYYYGNTEYPSSQIYQQDAYIKYCIYKTMTFVRLRGFPSSPFCNYEYAKHFCKTLIYEGRSIEVALAIVEFESTYGLGSRNVYGILDNRFNDGSPEGYCGFMDYYCGERDEMDWIMHGGYNPSAAYHNNVLRLSQQIRGEMY